MASLVTALGQKIVSTASGSLADFGSGMKGAFVSANPAVFGPMLGALNKGFSGLNKQTQNTNRSQAEQSRRDAGFREEAENERKRYEQILLSVQKGMAINIEAIQKDVRAILEILKKESLLDKLKNLLAGLAAVLPRGLGELLKKIPSALTDVAARLKNLFERFKLPKLDELFNKFRGLFERLKLPKLNELFNKIRFPETGKLLGQWFERLKKAIKLDELAKLFKFDDLKKIFNFDTLKSALGFGRAKSQIGSFFKTFGDELSMLKLRLFVEFQNLKTNIADTFKNLSKLITQSNLAQGAKLVFDDIKGKFVDLGKSFDTLKTSIVTSVNDSIKVFAESNMAKAFGLLADDIRNAASSIAKPFKELGTNIAKDISDIRDTFRSSVRSGATGAVGDGTRVGDAVGDAARAGGAVGDAARAGGAVGDAARAGGLADNVGDVVRGVEQSAEVMRDFGLFGGILAKIGALGQGLKGIITGPLKFIGELTDVTPFIKGIGKVLGPIGVIFSIFDGIQAAADTEALNKLFGQGNVGIQQRLSAFVGGFIGGFGGLFDFFADLMGFENTGFQESWTKNITLTVNKFFEGIKTVFKFIGDVIRSEPAQALFAAIGDTASKLVEGISSLFNFIKDIFMSDAMKTIYGLIGGLIAESIKNSIKVLGSIVELMVGIFTFDGDKIAKAGKDIWNTVTTGIQNSFRMIGNVIEQALTWVYDKIFGWWKSGQGRPLATGADADGYGVSKEFDVGSSTATEEPTSNPRKFSGKVTPAPAAQPTETFLGRSTGRGGPTAAEMEAYNQSRQSSPVSQSEIKGREGWLTVYAAAANAGDKFPEITASQWALETGWGSKMPEGSNNLFGIKARVRNVNGQLVPIDPYVMSGTKEWSESKGEMERVVAPFRKYDSYAESVADRVSRWSPKYASATTTDDALRAIVASGYATDPQYFSKLQSIIAKQTGLGVGPQTPGGPGSNMPTPVAIHDEEFMRLERESIAVQKETQRLAKDEKTSREDAAKIEAEYRFMTAKQRIEEHNAQVAQWKKEDEDRQYLRRREALFEEFNNNMKGIFKPMVDALMGPANTMSAAFNKGAGTNLSKALLDDFTKMGTKIFGQQYGPAMGSVFQRLAGVYMDQFIDKTLAPMLGINSDILNRSINTYLEGRSKFKQAISQAGAAVTAAKAALTEAEKKAGISTAEIVKASMPTVLGGKGFTSEQLSKISQLNSLRKNVETAEANLAAQKAQRRQYNMAALEDLMYGMTGIPFGPRSLIEAYGGGEKLTQDLATFFGSPIKPVFGLDEKDNRRLQAEDSLNRNYLTGQSKLLGNNLDAQAKLNAANATRLERVGDVWAEKVSYALSSGMSSGGGGSVTSAFNALVRQASPVYGSNETPTLLPGANVDEYGIPFLSSGSSGPSLESLMNVDTASSGIQHAISQNTYQLQDVSSSLGKVDFSLTSVKDSNLKLGDSTKSLTDTFGEGLKTPTPVGAGGTLRLPGGQVVGPSAGANLGNFGMNMFGTMLGARAAQKIGIQNPIANQMFMRFGSDLFTGKNPMANLKSGFAQAGSGGFGNALMGIMGLKYGNTTTLGGTLGTALAAYQTLGAIKSLAAGGSMAASLSGGISAIGQGISYAGQALGSSAISNFGAGLATTGQATAGAAAASGGAMGAGASAGQMMSNAAPVVLGAVGGHYLGRAISGGYAAGGGSGNTTVNAGTAIGAIIGSAGGPLGAAIGALIGGALGGAVNRLVGKKTDQIGSGLMGTLSNQNTDVTGYKETRTKYGFFRFKSDDFNTSAVALDPETAAAFKGITKDITKSIKSIGRMFDFNLDRFNDTYKESIKLNLQNAKTEEERQKIITDAFQKFGSNLVDFTLGSTGIAGFTRPGEDSLEALTRLATGRQAWLTMSAMGKNAPSFTGINEAGIARLFGYQVTDETNAGVTTKKYTLKDGLISGLNYGDLSKILNIDVGSTELQRGIADFLAGGRGEVTGKRAVSGTTQVPGLIYTQTGWGDSFDYSWVEGMVDEIVNGFADITVSIKDSLALYTADLSSKIIEEFGGDEKFNATMNKYIDLFYSAEEKLQMQKDSANTALQNAMDDLKDLGLQNLPSFANTTQESANNYRTYVDTWIKSVGGLIGIDTAEERAIYRTLTEAGITFMEAANINLNAANVNAGTANVNYAAANTFIPSLDFYGNKIVMDDTVPLIPGIPTPGANTVPDTTGSNPYGFTPPAPGTPTTSAIVNWRNKVTGETFMAPSGGWTAPSADWEVYSPGSGGANTVVTLPDTSVGPQLPGANNAPVTPQTPTTINGKTLPSNWSTFDAKQKIDWFNANEISDNDLVAAGVPVDDVTWMLQNGLKGTIYTTMPITLPENVTPGTTSNPITDTFLTADRENRQLDSVQREVSVNTAMVDNSVTNVNNSPRTTIIGGDEYRDDHPVFGGGRKLIYSRAYD